MKELCFEQMLWQIGARALGDNPAFRCDASSQYAPFFTMRVVKGGIAITVAVPEVSGRVDELVAVGGIDLEGRWVIGPDTGANHFKEASGVA